MKRVVTVKGDPRSGVQAKITVEVDTDRNSLLTRDEVERVIEHYADRAIEAIAAAPFTSGPRCRSRVRFGR